MKVDKVYKKYRRPTFLDREPEGTVYVNLPYQSNPTEIYIQYNSNQDHPIWLNIMDVIINKISSEKDIESFVNSLLS